jgi:signal transduction histidine kinase
MSVRHGLHATGPRASLLPPRLRPKSVRAKIVALLMVPIVSLMVLWASATVSTVRDAWTLRQFQELNASLAGPVTGLVTSLQAERAAATQYLSLPPGSGSPAEFEQQRSQTDAAVRTLQDRIALTSADVSSLAPDVRERMEAVTRDVARVHGEQARIVGKQLAWQQAYDGYTAVIDGAFAIDAALAGAQDGTAAQVVLRLAQIGEMLSRQDAVVSSALAQPRGRMTPEQQRAFVNALGGQQVLSVSVLPDLPPAERAEYQQMLDSASYVVFTSVQNAMLGDPAAPGIVSPNQWRAALQPITQDVTAIRTSADAAATAQTEQSSRSAFTESAITIVLGLLAVLLALLISVQIGRGLVVELVALRDSALELARRRLPQAMRRLRAGEKIDVDADVPVVPPGDGEIGEVGDALNAVQRSALQAASERAELLTGVSGVFVTLARRSQSLVHRQLSLLDAMERRTSEAEDLEDLFRLDHLAARMRRHAEGLIIMSGAAPGRTWSKPVPLMTAIRAAVAEVEEYQRVEIRRMADVSVAGAAVADLTHMIAELVENATSFSPPNTVVLVHGEPVGAGFVVEIEDRGLGMGADTMAEANRRIAEAHQLDLFESDQLGFFVVSRLANRQNITVTLRRSPYGGTTAVLLLPNSILTPFDPFAEPVEGTIPAARAAVTRLPIEPKGSVNRQPAMASGLIPPTDFGEWRPAPPPRQIPASIRPVEREPVSEPESPVPAARGEEDDSATGGLPRRTRQASLAPALRTPGGRHSGQEPEESSAPASPDEARAMMSAFQQGLLRGGRNGGWPTDEADS